MSNLRIFLEIAKASQARATELYETARTPKPDGRPGYVIRYDPSSESFKQSLIAIAFAGIYLDALLYVEGGRRLGHDSFTAVERLTLEERVRALGAVDPELLLACERFRNARNDLVHEKAGPGAPPDRREWRRGQDEAEHAIAVIDLIHRFLAATDTSRSA